DQFAGQYQFPYTAVIHNHPSEITGEDQPHLHLMYSERTISDDIERPPEQFFKQYRPKNPTQGGAQKLTADALGFGRNQVKVFREKTQELMNLFLEK
ncbi:MAG: plasmid mobilization protein, partial [Acinetobacter junii]